jgi:DNA-binding FadR family transcriptional regulator
MRDLDGLPAPPLTRARAHEVADYLAGVIAERLEPGDRLGTKEDVRRLTGVSIVTVNEATRVLDERGLIALRPGPDGGIFAAAPSPMVRVGQLFLQVRDDPERFSEAGAIRDALEPLIATDPIRYRTDGDVRALEDLLATMESSQDNIDEFLRADLALHQCIAAVTRFEIHRDLLRAIAKGSTPPAMRRSATRSAPSRVP